ncbi:173_t:CDS:1, partial [Gigaspora margarita]
MRCLPYGRVNDRELTMMIKVECVVNFYNEDSFDHAKDLGIAHVSIRDLIDENACVIEAR